MDVTIAQANGGLITDVSSVRRNLFSGSIEHFDFQ